MTIQQHSMNNVPTDLYIDGHFTEASGGARFDVVNPATEELLATVASAEIPDADAALDAAEKAMVKWAAKTPRERSEVLRKAWELIDSRLEEFAQLITLENGKGRADAIGEVRYAAEFFRWFAEEAVRADGLVTHAPASGARIIVQHKPAGLAVLVTPWNYPAAMGTRKIAPALAAGCAVIIKPAAETPLTMLALMPLLEEAGVPPGLVNVLPTNHPAEVVDHMLHDPRVRVVSFTGSTAVGRKLLKAAADQVLTPAMELGGNAPVIVFEDADMDTAIEGVMLAKMRNLGEACTAANRVYVHKNVAEAFTKRITERMSALKIGNGIDPDVDVGALVNLSTLEKVEGFVHDAVEKGAKVECGGRRLEGKGFFFPPTVLSNVSEDADCVHDEIFGPVVAIQTFEDQEDVIRRANDTEYGLVAYVFSSDMRRAMHVCERLDYGMVGLNRGLVSDPAAPFGGSKQSGLGREGGHEGMLEFMETQYISATW
ncbi:MAG: NAD-dependent succinate-semialdehyde dehydrogenase [Natronospirillum sp.]|uniref:NAD-dependent succinate-semialdehyde dehydrogenase n=1 Tax=Natronospirillum sp. TaxID=2812955 RepID=UPI0025E9673B|nr:NAD-dependent succinate-semialdehyde dehydrogenase [Natronospirillum sp.]MCH8550875.1 NAD-dependent succinate-semialdehyde dehydrogenase [Natronospirillum sp.]